MSGKHKYPKMVELEEVFGKPIEAIILDYLNRNDSVNLTADLLGISFRTLQRWLVYLNIKPVTRWEVKK
jgi:transcriptional regulator with PAS, ATPase and Fis domain